LASKNNDSERSTEKRVGASVVYLRFHTSICWTRLKR